jgi:hypothetical protein
MSVTAGVAAMAGIPATVGIPATAEMPATVGKQGTKGPPSTKAGTPVTARMAPAAGIKAIVGMPATGDTEAILGIWGRQQQQENVYRIFMNATAARTLKTGGMPAAKWTPATSEMMLSNSPGFAKYLLNFMERIYKGKNFIGSVTDSCSAKLFHSS